MTRFLLASALAASCAVSFAPAASADECYGFDVAGVCATSWCADASCSVRLPGAYAFCEHPLPVGWCANVAFPPGL